MYVESLGRLLMYYGTFVKDQSGRKERRLDSEICASEYLIESLDQTFIQRKESAALKAHESGNHSI